jgi:uncharacterized protein (TIGR02145 family)
MKTRVLTTVAAAASLLYAHAQKPAIQVTFTALDSASYVQLDSIRVMNRTQGGDTLLVYPDTVLTLSYQVGLPEHADRRNCLKVFQNEPNPVVDQTTVTLYVPAKGIVTVMAGDVLGRQVMASERVLEKGYHGYLFFPGKEGLYFFTACLGGSSSTIRIVQGPGGNPGRCSLEYLGGRPPFPEEKSAGAVSGFSFLPGDSLLYVGCSGMLQSGILDRPDDNVTRTFQFARNISCPGTPTVTYEGQVYHTIQIFSQCWLKENLNAGTLIPGTQQMGNNGVMEKYCYDNQEDSCAVYGGLYQWNEMMQYATGQGVRGICPPGWHIPSDEEWKVLEGSVDSHFGIGDPAWDEWYDRGYDAGINLKSSTGWPAGGNGSDLFGFSALPGGRRDYLGDFCFAGLNGTWWTGTNTYTSYAWYRSLSDYGADIGRNQYDGALGFSVRCLRDE